MAFVESKSESATKDKIFRTAAHLFAEKGYNGVSMREISEQAGVTKPAIYYYFNSKEDIYKELVQSALNFGNEKLKQVLAKDLPVRQKLVEIIKGHFRGCLQNPEYVQFFISLATSSEKLPFLEDFKEQALETKKGLTKLIQSGKDSGEFGPGVKPELAAAAINGAMLIFIIRQLNSKKKILSDQLAEEIMELFFKGLNE